VLDAHGERLFATLLRLTLRPDVAAELLQELFVRLAQSDGFDAAADPVAYAWRTAINLAMEWRRNRRPEWSAAGEVEIASVEPSPLQRMVQAEQFEQLLNGLSELTELSRQAFVLRYIEQQSYGAVAEKIGKTPHQARGLCHAAVRQLRERFANA
jgi:RNA polymerase sigma-70 factor (ECF subfamily)